MMGSTWRVPKRRLSSRAAWWMSRLVIWAQNCSGGTDHAMSSRLWGLLYRPVDFLADPRHAVRQARRNPVRTPRRRPCVRDLRPSGSACRVSLPAAVAGDVRHGSECSACDARPARAHDSTALTRRRAEHLGRDQQGAPTDAAPSRPERRRRPSPRRRRLRLMRAVRCSNPPATPVLACADCRPQDSPAR